MEAGCSKTPSQEEVHREVLAEKEGQIIAPPPRQEGMTREDVLRVTAQIRAWDKHTVAFDAAIQQLHANDVAQRETITQQVVLVTRRHRLPVLRGE